MHFCFPEISRVETASYVSLWTLSTGFEVGLFLARVCEYEKLTDTYFKLLIYSSFPVVVLFA